MSCPSNQNPVRLVVAMGSLPEGFCGNPQQLGDAIAARLIVTPDQNNATFVSGSVAPTSNVGPWLKNCEQWFRFDDATGTYIIMTKGGFDTLVSFPSNGTFQVPPNIYKLLVEGWGGGGGGSAPGGSAGSGGGGGGYGLKIFSVIPGQNIEINIGAGGGSAAAGTDTTIKSNSITIMTCGGGAVGDVTGNTGGLGGSVTGADFSIIGGSGGRAFASSGAAGGDSPKGGMGGVLSDAATNHNGKVPGGAGAGATIGLIGGLGGSGANGQVLVWY